MDVARCLRIGSLLAAVIATALLASSCRSGQPSSAEEVTVESVALQTPDSARTFTPSLSGPLRILSATPRGSMRSMQKRQPITITFSRPMVPLGDPPPVSSDVLEIAPNVEGSYRWEGTQTLVFTPDAPLPAATAFEVRLNPVLSDREGQTIDEAFTWAFETPRPRLLRSEPPAGEAFAAPRPSFRLHFNLPVDPNVAREYLSFPAKAEGDVESEGDSTLVVTPGRATAKGETIQLVLNAGLPSTVGSLGLADAETLSVRVHPALEFSRLAQPGTAPDAAFAPGQGLEVEFSTPVRFETVRTAVSFEPAVDWPAGIEAQDDQVSTSHVLPVSLEPETAYRLRVGGLEDVFGQTLERATRSFRTRAYEPQLSMDTGRLVVEAEQYAILPLRATNVETVDLGMTRIGADEIVPALRTYDDRYYGRDAPGQPKLSPVPFQRTVDLGLERNTPSLYPLYVDSMLTAGSGIVGVRLRWQPGGRRSPQTKTALAQVTLLGITGKYSPHQQLIVVTDLSTGKPVANASVTLRNRWNEVLWTGPTDGQGRAQAPGWRELAPEADLDTVRGQPDAVSPLYVVAEHQGDLAFSSSAFDDGVEPYRFGLNYDWDPQPRTNTGQVFTDRGLYKAGEPVHVKAILRTKTDDAWSSPTDSVRFLIRDPRDEIVHDETVLPSDLGTFDTQWTPPAGAAQGTYQMHVAALEDSSVYADRPWYRDAIATSTFRVDSFRKAQFSVTAQTPADAYVAGDFFEGSISARYLFGAGMEGQPVRYSLLRRNTYYEPPGYSAYRFGPLENYAFDELLRADTTLDSTSTARARLQLPTSESGAPSELIWNGTVTSPSRQEISDQTRLTLHPALYYVGLKTETSFLDLSRDSILTVDVMTADPGGTPVGDKSVTVELVRREWDSVREVGADGRMRWRSEPTETVLRSRTITTEAGSAQRLRMVVPEGGQYEVRATSQDVRGNAVQTETYVYATGEGYVAWRRDNDDRIEIIPDRSSYAPGETARLMVQSPYEEATALITVEREGIISSRVERVSGSTPQIDLPLTDRHLPNVYVSVILLNGRTAPPQKTSDPGAPGFKIGYTSLRVDPGQKRLRVEVTPDQETYRPGEQASVHLRLTDAQGNGVPGEVAFSAADAGVLNLIGYSLPDPFDAFYGPRSLGVRTSESRADLVEQRSYGQKAESVGGGGGSGEFMMRTDFRPLAHWAPAVQTDGRGRATVTFRFPESLTTFRLMATALTANHRFGQGQTDVTVTKPLVLQPALPRFARRGDLFEAGVLISNRTREAGRATITAEAEGLSLQSGAERTISMDAGATREVRFSWDALTAGDARLRFRASLNGEQDAFETTMPVQLPRVTTASAQFASTTQPAAEEALRLPEDRLSGLGELDVQLSSTALVGLGGALEHLFTYPYGCLEQRVSRVRPLLVSTEVVNLFDLKGDVLGGSRNQVVTEWLQDLREYWLGDGFGLWSSSEAVHPYVSAYTLLALADAEAAGYRVPQPLTSQVADALERSVRQRSERPDYYSEAVWADTRALMLYALVRHGRVLESELSALANRPPESPAGLSHLLRAVVAAQSPVLDRYTPALADRLEQQIRVEGTRAYLTAPRGGDFGWIFASDVRATAHGLTALLEYNAGPDLQLVAQRMIRYLMDNRQGGHWASTQDNAAVLDAFRAYVEAYETETPDFTARVQLSGREILSRSFQGRSLQTGSTEVAADRFPSGRTLPLQIQKEGDGRLYYTMRLRTYTSGPVDARSQGLSVERQLQRLDDSGTPVGEWRTVGGGERSLPPGALVRIRLRVTSPTSRSYVVVDDALPAGLEAVNTAFATADAQLEERAETGTGTWWGSFNHTELRDDRVLLFANYLRRGEHTYTYVARATTPGTFRHPPAEAEMMYAPATRGRTASGTLVVEIPDTQASSR